MEGATPSLFSCKFEVFGKVQGVYFRKHTYENAEKLGLRGWCMNTNNGTVKGKLEGPLKAIEAMQKWLKKVGSPASRIDRALFTRTKEIESYESESFIVKK